MHVRGAYRQSNPRGEDVLCNSMNVNDDGREDMCLTDTTEQSKREVRIEERETGLRVWPRVEVDRHWVKSGENECGMHMH